MENEVQPEAVKPSFADLDALADLHERMSNEESAVTRLSRRVTALEDAAKGHYSGDDPMANIPWGALIFGMVLLQVLPIVVDMVKQCRSQSS